MFLSTPRRRRGAAPVRFVGLVGFTLVELLVVIGIIALLLSILMPTLASARRASKTVVCLSNVRQLGMATLLYANENRGHFPPAAADGGTTNLLRWHGSRASAAEPFELTREPSPLRAMLAEGIKECPELDRDGIVRGFEAGAGGYGFSQDFLGSLLSDFGATWPLPGEAYSHTPRITQVKNSAETVMFADTAFAYDWASGPGLYEYSFVAEPIGAWGPMWPSIHFRHSGRKTVVCWVDGHATAETFEWTMEKTDPFNWYGIDFAKYDLGWFGPKDNRLFDRK